MIQYQFINKILETKDSSLITLNNLTEDFFSDYKEEFRYIKEHLDKYGNIPDRLSFTEKFSDFELYNVAETKEYLIDELYKDYNTRQLAAGFNNVRKQLMEGNPDDALETVLNLANDAVKAKHLSSVNLLEDTSRYNTYLERCDDFNKYYVKTGFAELDKVIGGWDRKEELAVIAARSGVGKTWALLKSAAAALEQGLRVGIYSGEMSENKVGYRIDTLISGISNSGITRGDIGVQVSYKRYIDSLKDKYSSGALMVLTPTMIGGPATVTALRAFIEKDNLDILFVDQHSLLEDERKAKNPVERAANISRDLKNLQVMKKIPIISVSQQNRASTENGVGTEHIAQSDRIAQDSTVILFFEQKEGILTVHLVKSRDSVNNKKLRYAVDFDRGLFQFIPEEDSAAGAESVKELAEDYGEDIF